MIKTVIVEDEKIIRQGIITLINWEALDCEIVLDCSNGIDALNFLKTHQVDLVITDIIMPKSNGLELCEAINTYYPTIKMLILSSHSDFSYAQEALRYGVSDYIIKTNFIKELPIAVGKIVSEVKEKKLETKEPLFKAQDLDQIKIMFLESILYHEGPNSKKIDQLMVLLGQDLTHYYMLFSDLEYMKTPDEKENYFNAMINFYNVAFQDVWHMSFWRDNHSILTLVNFKDENPDSSLQKLVLEANKILSTVNNYMSFQLNISISNCHYSLHELKVAYEESISNLNNSDIENYLSLYQEDSEKLIVSTMPSKKDVVKKFLYFIRAKELNGLDAYLTNLFTSYQYTFKGLEQVKIDLLIIMAHCFRSLASEDMSHSPLENLEEELNSNLLQCHSLHALLKTITKGLEELNRVTKSTDSPCNSLVLHVNTYIKENYASCVKLSDLGKELHVNSSYLSRLYKSETGDSIITTLNKYRINKAKELLETGHYLVSEVAYLVGINDPAYFTNVFTKQVGISPKNYMLK